VKLEKNEDYQPSEGEASGLAGDKTGVCDVISFDVVADASTRIAGIKNGQYDVVEEVPLDNYEELTQESGVKMSVNQGGTLNLFLNTTEGVMANEDMRQAVLAALNCVFLWQATAMKSCTS